MNVSGVEVLFTIVVAMAAAVTGFLARRPREARDVIRLLTDEIAAYKIRSTRLEGELAEVRAENAGLTQANKLLQGMVTGVEERAETLKLLKDLHAYLTENGRG